MIIILQVFSICNFNWNASLLKVCSRQRKNIYVYSDKVTDLPEKATQQKREGEESPGMSMLTGIDVAPSICTDYNISNVAINSRTPP